MQHTPSSCHNLNENTSTPWLRQAIRPAAPRKAMRERQPLIRDHPGPLDAAGRQTPSPNGSAVSPGSAARASSSPTPPSPGSPPLSIRRTTSASSKKSCSATQTVACMSAASASRPRPANEWPPTSAPFIRAKSPRHPRTPCLTPPPTRGILITGPPRSHRRVASPITPCHCSPQ